MLEKQKMAKHLTHDRINRAVYIASTIGVGNEIIRSYNEKKDSYSCLTDTGVMIIRNPKGAIITMYIASMNQAIAMTHNQLSKTLRNIIKRNEKEGHLAEQDSKKFF